ncbi:M12 family metallopeptidase [Bacillus mycoides]|uniref:M12 family metallopeptidase n=1 Tax=Bacillus mycoides TaxID=1405 RepID=UPI001F08B97D|nr:M12 family metallopeptidase [Bacillus mycoides]
MDILKICTQTFDDISTDSPSTEYAVGARKKFWEIGSTLRVHFLDGGSDLRQKVEEVAHIWEEYANIKFTFVNDINAEIRITFEGQDAKSKVGRDCLTADAGQPTMWLGMLKSYSREEDIRAIILHEFGHALGLYHEHQHPDGGIPWDENAVYKYFMGPPNNWTREQVKSNVLDRYSKEETNYTKLDKESIMMYAISNDLTIGDYETKWNTQLSATDKEFIRTIYPKGDLLYKGDRLHPGEDLKPHEALISSNGKYALVMQRDGNLVLYPVGSINALWSSGTYGKTVSEVILQNDGNFVMYGEGQALWSTNTYGHTVAWIAVQNDGNVVIYEPTGKPIWATNTVQS